MEDFTSNIDSEIESNKVFNLIAKTAITTVYWLVIVVMLGICCLAYVFPYNSMKIYADFGMTDRALQMGEIAISREAKRENFNFYESKYTATLIDVLLYSSIITNNAVNGKSYNKVNWDKVSYYAKKTIKYTDKYLDVTNISQRNKLIDEFNYSNSPPSIHANVYSYDESLRTGKMKAQLYCNEGLEKTFSDMTSLVNTLYGYNSETRQRYLNDFIILSQQLSAYIEFELLRIDFISNKESDMTGLIFKQEPLSFNMLFDYEIGFTLLYKNFTKIYSEYRDFIVKYNTNGDIKEQLKQLYYTKVINNLVDNMYSFAHVLYSKRNGFNEKLIDDIIMEYQGENNSGGWLNNLHNGLEGEDKMSLETFYINKLLPKYISDFNNIR